MRLPIFDWVRTGLSILVFAFAAGAVSAAPYAAMVMDARTGEVLHARNADTRLHPASLTKMMTLYVAFEAVARGEISLDTRVKISKKAAAEQPSKLGLRAGQRIALRYLIRAAAVKSANDAATAIGEAISGSEAAFARRMTRTAQALGMSRTTFKNAHGLTESGHMSTARDMTKLGRHMIYDYPQYYNLFSRRSTDAGGTQVNNTNRRLLNAYKGADGIKTGYTRAAGFNLVASAERGKKRVIATVFGGSSTAARNARVAELLDMGFKRAPNRAKTNNPALPVYAAQSQAKRIKLAGAVTSVRKSSRPMMRPARGLPQDVLAAVVADAGNNAKESREAVGDEVQVARAANGSVMPIKRPANFMRDAFRETIAKTATQEVITRASTSGGRQWSIHLGRYTTRDRAERLLLQTALQEIGTLDEALRKVVNHPRGWEANFVGLSQDRANLACARLSARNVDCEVRRPDAS